MNTRLRKRKRLLPESDSSDSEAPLSRRPITSIDLTSSPHPPSLQIDDEKALKPDILNPIFSRDSSCPDLSARSTVDTDQKSAEISRLSQAVESLQQAMKVLEGRFDSMAERVPSTNIPYADHIGEAKHFNRPCLTMKEPEQLHLTSEAPPLPPAAGSEDNNARELWSAAQLLTLGCQLKTLIVNQMHRDFGPVTAIKPSIPTHLNTVDTCHPDPPKLSKAAKKAKKNGTSSIPPLQSNAPPATHPPVQPPLPMVAPSLNAQSSLTKAVQAQLPPKPLYPTHSNQYNPGVSQSHPPMPYGTHRNDWSNANRPSGPTYPSPVPQASQPVQNILPYYPAPPLISQPSQSSSRPASHAIQSSKPKPTNANLTPLNPHRGTLSNFSQLAASGAAATPALQSKADASATRSTGLNEPNIPNFESPSIQPTTNRQIPSNLNAQKANAAASGSTAPVEANILQLLHTHQPRPSKGAKKMYSQLINHPDPMARCVLEVCVRVIETITNAEVVEELVRLPVSAEVRRMNTLLGHLFQSQAETEQKLQGLLDSKCSEIKDDDVGARSHLVEGVVPSSVSAEVSRIKGMLGHLIHCQNETAKLVYNLLDHHQKSKIVNSGTKNEIPAKTISLNNTSKKDATSESHQVNMPNSELATQQMLATVQDYAKQQMIRLHEHVDKRLVDLESCDLRSMREDMKAQVSQFKQDLESTHHKFDSKLEELRHGLEKKIVSVSQAAKDQKLTSERGDQMLATAQDYAKQQMIRLHEHVDKRLFDLERCDLRSMREDMKAQVSQFKQDLESTHHKFDSKLEELRHGLEKKIVSESQAAKDQKLTSERGAQNPSCNQNLNLDDLKYLRPLIEEEVANVMTASFEEDLKDSIQSDLMYYLESEISILNQPNEMIREELEGYLERRLQEFQSSFRLNPPRSILTDDAELKQKLSFMTHRTSPAPVEVHHTPGSRPDQSSLRNASNHPETSQPLSIPVASKLFAPLNRLIKLEEDIAVFTSPESQRKATFVSLGLCRADTNPKDAGMSVENMLFELIISGLRKHKDKEHVKGFTSEVAVIMRQVFDPIFEPMLNAIDAMVDQTLIPK